MAVTDVDIANLALGRVGHTQILATLAPNGRSDAERQANRLLPLVRDRILQQGGWPWAERIETLALSTVEIPGWSFVYDRPDDCLTIQSICDAAGAREWSRPTRWDTPNWTRLPRPPYRTFGYPDGEVIATDVEAAYIVGSYRIDNPARFPPLVVDAIAWGLAVELGAAFKVDPRIVQNAVAMAAQALDVATAASLNEAQDDDQADSPSIRSRG